MDHQYRMHGSRLSFFSGKLRGYLNYKGLDFEDAPVGVYDLVHGLKRKIGAAAIPALETDQGEWLGDTTAIIEELERRHPNPPIEVASPVQHIASMLLEAWIDECWTIICMHTRWSFEEDAQALLRIVGPKMFPFLPKGLATRVADKVMLAKIRKHLPAVGAVPEQYELLERWMQRLIGMLETHLAEQPYLFGARPTVADYSLVGALHAHLTHDPWPKRVLMNDRPNLWDYTERVHEGKASLGDLPEDDAIPATLEPIFETVFAEFFPLLDQTVESLEAVIERDGAKSGGSLPRALEEIEYPMADGRFKRTAGGYVLWQMQRVQKICCALSEADGERVAQWLASRGQPDLRTMNLGPELERDGLTVRLV